MNRAVLAYILMFAVLVGGLWAILNVGRGLSAPHDLSGEWSVRPDYALGAEPQRMRVIQSGQFLVVELPDMPQIKVRLQREERDAAGNLVAMHWAGDDAKLVVRIPAASADPQQEARYWFELEKPKRAAWRARRVAGDEIAAVSTAQ